MLWMISHQQARRNLELGELIFANSMVAEEIALENKEKISKAVSESNKNRALNPNCVQVDANERKRRDTVNVNLLMLVDIIMIIARNFRSL